jgi:ERCC4-type nuclease
MLLKVDMRESSLIPVLQKQVCSVEKARLEVCSMPLGDAGIYTDDGDELVLFERKTLADLAASIKDGRYSEQSFRLAGIDTPNHNIVYVIEGTFDQYKLKTHNVHPTTLLSSLVSLNYFKGFSVMRTCNSVETCDLIIRYLEKIIKSKGKKPFYSGDSQTTTETVQGGSTPSYTSVVKRVKKENVTVNNIVSLMLCQVPNVSTASAEAIAARYTTMDMLVSACKTGRHVFDEVRIGRSKRRLSGQCIHNVMRYVLGKEEDELSVETS